MAELLISATNMNTQQIGEVVDTKSTFTGNQKWGLVTQPPNYVHLTIPDATREEVDTYLNFWNIRFQYELVSENATEYRITVSVDPIYIAASEMGKHAMRDAMQDWAASVYEGVTVAFTSDSMTVDLPKPLDLAEVKANFADIFNTFLAPRRYHFSIVDVNAALANGGKITLTRAQALSKVVDKLDL
jgi:hypothetical protein